MKLRSHWVFSALVPGMMLALGAGCAPFPKAPRLGPGDFPNVTAVPPPARAPGAKVPLDPDVKLVPVDAPEIRAAMAEFMKSGKPPVIVEKDRRFVRFPYGHSEPILYCKPLRVCDLELQAGEHVLDVALGDAERWHAQKMESGPAGNRSPHVIFKPVQDGISTNAIITTDRRVYNLGLIARPDETGENLQRYVRHASFYYPDETVTAWTSEAERKHADVAAAQAAALRASDPAIPPKRYTGYTITGDDVPWRPVSVFDDGTHVYIQMPPTMKVTEAPALWVIDPFGEEELVNYRVRNGTYIVDRLFGRARLAVGAGKKASQVFITRETPEAAAKASEKAPSPAPAPQVAHAAHAE